MFNCRHPVLAQYVSKTMKTGRYFKLLKSNQVPASGCSGYDNWLLIFHFIIDKKVLILLMAEDVASTYMSVVVITPPSTKNRKKKNNNDIIKVLFIMFMFILSTFLDTMCTSSIR